MKPTMPFVKGEGGFTTPAAAVALLVACSLAFMCVHGAVVAGRSGQIQYVADAGALAADNVVADFVTVGQTVDAMILSLSLAALSVYAASAVAAFIPGGASVAGSLAETGSKMMTLRDKFSNSAVQGLNKLQEALPALCAVRAYECVRANAQASGIDYTGLAFALPSDGVSYEIADVSKVDETVSDITSREEAIQQKALRQDEAQQEKNAAKERAWRADCGNDGMSMYERAGHLSTISSASNPYYASSETWSFSVPLARAKAYYSARKQAEPGASYQGTPEQVGQSVARKHFYEYALAEVSKGSVSYNEQGVEAPDLKALARNTEQIKQTYLYTQAVYPVSTDGTAKTLHAYTGCPGYTSGQSAGVAAVCDIDSGAVLQCSACCFSATTLGRVPSASTSIDNGFEYYYREVVEASQEYNEAVAEDEQLRAELEEDRSSIENSLSDAVASIAAQRYDPQPPGRYGCICVVYAPAMATSTLPFLSTSGGLSQRMAISGATLAADPDSNEGNVISDIGQGLVSDCGVISGFVQTAFGAWGTMLQAYSDGNDAVSEGVDKVLGSIPLVGTELSQWASKSFKGALTSAGLEPANLKTYKPVLVNTSYILERDEGAVSSALLNIKSAGTAYSSLSIGDIQEAISLLPNLPDLGAELSDEGFSVAEFPLGDIGLGISDGCLAFSMPSNIKELYEQATSAFALIGGG